MNSKIGALINQQTPLPPKVIDNSGSSFQTVAVAFEEPFALTPQILLLRA